MADNKQIYIPSNHYAEKDTIAQDQPLDPAVERIRQKLMRLMAISISITLVLILAVLFGVIYKIMAPAATSQQKDSVISQNQNSKVAHHTLSLPKGSQILSQSLSEHNIVLKILTPEGQIQFMIYNYYTGALIAIFSVKTTQEKTLNPPSL
ncbi:hypothetical protein [Bartonella sp. B30(2025)]